MRNKVTAKCENCNNTPRLGQLYCGRCIEKMEIQDELNDLKNQFWRDIDTMPEKLQPILINMFEYFEKRIDTL